MVSCFGLVRPHQHGIAVGQRIVLNALCSQGALHPPREKRADYIGLLVLLLPDDYAMLMRPNKAETAVHGGHCLGDMAVHMRKVLARPFSRSTGLG